MKKTGYKVLSYSENKEGLEWDFTEVHLSDESVPDFIKKAFEDYPKLREVSLKGSSRWNSVIKRVHVYTKKGR